MTNTPTWRLAIPHGDFDLFVKLVPILSYLIFISRFNCPGMTIHPYPVHKGMDCAAKEAGYRER
jgi:hypothetical protein